MGRRSSYSRSGRDGNRFRRVRFRFDSEVNRKRAQARRFSYCYPSRPLPIKDDWPNRDASDTRCKITIYAFEGTPDEIDDINAYGNTMTHQFYGHIVEVEVDCWSRFSFRSDVYFVKDKFPSRNEAVEFADAIPEPISYEYLKDKDNGFQKMR